MVPYPANSPTTGRASAGGGTSSSGTSRSNAPRTVPGRVPAGRRAPFPKVMLRFDPRTGAANASPSPYVVQAAKETRFRIAGNRRREITDTRDMRLIRGRPAVARRLADVRRSPTTGGRCRRAPARVRLFALPGQRGPVTRTLTLGVRAPFDVAARPFTGDLEPRDEGRRRGRFGRVVVSSRSASRRAGSATSSSRLRRPRRSSAT